MKITIMTLGSRGDVEPFVALGKGLKRASHDVTLCSSVSFQNMVTRHGLTYAYVNDELLKLAGTREGRSAMEKRGNPFRLIRQVRPPSFGKRWMSSGQPHRDQKLSSTTPWPWVVITSPRSCAFLPFWVCQSL